MTIKVKFIGALRHASGTNELTVNCERDISVKDLIREIAKELPELNRNLGDPQLEEPRVNSLILVNGREISVLNGLETNLKDGDNVVFVSVVHGG
jgi:molybdopterin synthase sulfur carrier subunit